jgi:hypothetical protein
MIRARLTLAATLVGASFVATAFAQTPAAPPMTSVLAGKKFTPPVKGDAQVDFIASPTRRDGTTLVTKVQVKNMSPAPIARLKIAETWYDKDGNAIPGGDAVINGLLQPGEVQTLEIKTPVNPKMTASKMQFTHANGPVNKPHKVTKFDGDAKDAAKPAAKPAAKKK